MGDYAWVIIIISILLSGYALLVSIYFALDGFVRLPKPRVYEKLPEGLHFLLFIGLIGSLGWSGGVPFYWRAFMDMDDGVLLSIRNACWLITVDLWLFWIPANMWVNHQQKEEIRPNHGLSRHEIDDDDDIESYLREHDEIDDEEDVELYLRGYRQAIFDFGKFRTATQAMARVINLLVGLLLITENNPIVKILTFLGDDRY